MRPSLLQLSTHLSRPHCDACPLPSAQVSQLKGALVPTTKEAPAVETIAVTDEMKVSRKRR